MKQHTDRKIPAHERELLKNYLAARGPFRTAFDKSREKKRKPKSPEYDRDYREEHSAYEKTIAPIRAEFDAALSALRTDGEISEGL